LDVVSLQVRVGQMKEGESWNIHKSIRVLWGTSRPLPTPNRRKVGDTRGGKGGKAETGEDETEKTRNDGDSSSAFFNEQEREWRGKESAEVQPNQTTVGTGAAPGPDEKV